MSRIKVLAIICAYNEGDVIRSIIGELVGQGVDVYLMDHNSTDDTAGQAEHWLGRGLLHIERFPQDAGYPERNIGEFVLTDILNRKEEISRSFSEYDWFIHCDADEIRTGPWPGKSLLESFEEVDRQGFNAINHQTYHFVPVDDSFQRGADVRQALPYFQERAWFASSIQVKSWKRTEHAVHLSAKGGHRVAFPGIRIFPLRFLLLHYPLRGHSHGKKKIFMERLPRYAPDAVAKGWHIQYRGIAAGTRQILAQPGSEFVRLFDLETEQRRILADYERDTGMQVAGKGRANDARLQSYSKAFSDLVGASSRKMPGIDKLTEARKRVLRDPFFEEFASMRLSQASLAHDYVTARKVARLQQLANSPPA